MSRDRPHPSPAEDWQSSYPPVPRQKTFCYAYREWIGSWSHAPVRVPLFIQGREAVSDAPSCPECDDDG